MAKKFPLHPKNPERICWGCDKYCPVDSLACGNGSERTQHPVELFGDDWFEWGLDAPAEPADDTKKNTTANRTEDATGA
jgi:hypothetical protein